MATQMGFVENLALVLEDYQKNPLKLLEEMASFFRGIYNVSDNLSFYEDKVSVYFPDAGINMYREKLEVISLMESIFHTFF